MRHRFMFQLLGPISSAVARQLALPSGWLGRILVTRVLNRGNRELITTTLDTLPLSRDVRLLDVGFGGGLALRLARERGVVRLVGVDPSRTAVEALRRSCAKWLDGGELTLAEGGVEQLPVDDGSVGAVISTNTVYFWRDLPAAFAELRRVLVSGGHLALGFSSSDKMRAFDTITRHGFLHHDNRELVERAEEAGFREVRLIELRGRDTVGDYVLRASRE